MNVAHGAFYKYTNELNNPMQPYIPPQSVYCIIIVEIAINLHCYKHITICDRLCKNRPCSHLVVIRETLV